MTTQGFTCSSGDSCRTIRPSDSGVIAALASVPTAVGTRLVVDYLHEVSVPRGPGAIPGSHLRWLPQPLAFPA